MILAPLISPSIYGVKLGRPIINNDIVSTGALNLFYDDQSWRLTARDGELCWDCTLTETGFSGTEDIDWYNAASIESGWTDAEDLTTYTKVDPESNFSVETNKVTVTNIHPEHTISYLYYDFGADYFKKDFEIRFALKVADIWEAHALQGIIGVSNTIGLTVEGPNIEINYDYTDAGSGANYIIGVGGGDHVAHTNQNQFLVGTTYYVKIERIYVGGETDNIFQATVYTDSDYTIRAKNLYGGQVGEDIAPWGEQDFTLAEATEEFRYLMLATSSRGEYSDTEIGSFEISNVKIISNED